MCDNERLCAMEPCFTIERIISSDGLNLETMSLREMGPQLKLPIKVPSVGG